MSHFLIEQIDVVARRARRAVLLHGAAWTVVVLAAAVTAAAGVDYLLGVDEAVVRVLLSLSVAATIGWGARRFAWPAARYRPTRLEIAQRVERRFPEVRGELASAVDFLARDENDPAAGSAQLRRRAVAEVEARMLDLDWREVVDWGPARRATAAAAAMLAAVLAIVVWAPSYAATAAARLAMPLGSRTWPREHYLEIRQPVERVAVGESFEVEVVDRGGRLPADLRMQYRYAADDGAMLVEEAALAASGDAAVARKEHVTQPFAYRAVGGDDQHMRWREVEVVDAPRLESAEAVLEWPAYTGLLPQRLANRSRHIDAVAGTRLRLRAASDQALSAARLHWGAGRTAEAALGSGGRGLVIPAAGGEEVSIAESGPMRLELAGEDNLLRRDAATWEVRLWEDAAPSVSLTEPAMETLVTPEAVIDVRGQVRDKLAIRRVELVYTRSDETDRGEQRIELFAGPSRPPQLEADSPLAASEARWPIDFRWDLGPLELSPGTTLSFHAAASDYQPKTGTSSARRLRVVTVDEMSERVRRAAAKLLDELERIERQQRETHWQLKGAWEQLAKVGRLRPGDAALLRGAERNQRQLRRRLSGGSEGAAGRATELLSTIEQNRLTSTDETAAELGRRLLATAEALERLESGPLREIERELLAAMKTSQAAVSEGAEAEGIWPGVQASLAQAMGGQEEVMEVLERLVAAGRAWTSRQRLAGELEAIERQQRALREETEDLGRQTLGRAVGELDRQQAADLAKLAGREEELGKAFGRVFAKMAQQLGSGAPQPAGAEAIEQALAEARGWGLDAEFGRAASDVAANRLGQGTSRQASIEQRLGELAGRLLSPGEKKPAGLLAKHWPAGVELEETREQIAKVRAALERLRRRQPTASGPEARRLARELERLVREQEALRERIDQLADELQRLEAAGAARSARQAAGETAKSAAATKRGDLDDAIDRAAEAERALDEAEAQWKADGGDRQAEAELAQQQMARLSDALQGLAERQARVAADAEHYGTLQAGEGLSRAQAQSVAGLGQVELELAEACERAAEGARGAAVVQWALSRSAQEMRGAAAALAEIDCGVQTQRRAKAALAYLEQIVAAMERDAGETEDRQGAGGKGGNAPAGGQGPSRDIDVSQWKLLRQMQETINRRTRELHEQRRRGALTEPQRREYTELAEQQRELAELLLQMAAPPVEEP